MANEENRFNFEHFESLRGDQAAMAKGFLNEKFPSGTSAAAVIAYLKAGGAKCSFVKYNGYFYLCEYMRPGHGLMALVSTIEWRVAVNTGPDGQNIIDIDVGRSATGM